MMQVQYMSYYGVLKHDPPYDMCKETFIDSICQWRNYLWQ
jgi:hypothetical protein